ncbi:hypothetical protein QBC47DRAFT_306505 [Echria macrotheca]|uniref:C2H2-type domain-containing protein n=1 Tax=Echria macrotheca TaxID=438768 RepID=A0AAJ0B5I3_9PEZI|nr:hypothetical protein QBC47DRAFT_306505 [Echria macrotheca]
MQEDVQLPAPGSDQFTQGSSPSTTREARSDSYGGTPEGQAFIRAKHEQAWDEAAASDHDGRRKKQKRATADKTVAGGSSKKFACPYFKRNPKKYSKWTSCPGPGWDEVHRVKTHLYRRHALPTQCPRCWQLFKVEDSLSAHLQQNPPCVTRENSTPFEGFTKDQEKKLRSRKKAQADTTDEDKWREIYTILFPDDDPASFPSPYYDTTYYEADETTTSPPRAGDFEDYASFVKREMPTLVRRELEIMFEHEFADIDERVRPRVADVVVRAQTRLLELYRQSQMPLSEYGPSSGGIGGSSSDSSLTPALSHRTSSGTGNADSTPVMDGTVIPPIAAGTGQDPFQFHGSSMPLTFDFDPSALPLGTWDFVGGQQPEEEPEYSTSGGSTGDFSWDAELDKLINPGLFVPQIGEMRNPGAYGVASSGAEVPSQVVPRDGAGWYQYSHT